MERIRVQYEIRYTHILNFLSYNRDIVNPYLRLPNVRFSIENLDSLKEYIVLSFHEELYSIDCRLDRMIFIAEGSHQELNNSTGPLKQFFDIFDKLSKINTFGDVVSNILSVFFVQHKKDKDSNTIVKEFKKRFLNDNINVYSDIVDNLSDIGITLEADNKKRFMRLKFGPYFPEDFDKLNLSPFKSAKSLYLKEYSGYVSEVFINDKNTKPDFSTFAKMLRLSEEIAHKIHNEE